jgi:predicted dehydrogenase
VERLRGWIDAGAVGTPERLDIEVAFAAWPRGWQRDAAGWLDRRAEGGFTREVVSHFLFLTGRALGPLSLLERSVTWPPDGRSERAIAARLTAGGVAVSLSGGVGTTAKDDHNTWTLTGSAGRVRLRDWAFAERAVDGGWRGDPDALPQDRARPLVLRRQLEAVAAMTRGEPHPLATLEEAFAVQRIVGGVLAG